MTRFSGHGIIAAHFHCFRVFQRCCFWFISVHLRQSAVRSWFFFWLWLVCAGLTFVTFPFVGKDATIRGMIASQISSIYGRADTIAVAGRVQFIEHLGKRVLFIDYSNCDAAMMKDIACEGHRVLALQPPTSALTLNDVTGASFDHESVAALKSMVAANAPFVKRGAVIGISGLQRLIYDAVQAFSKRKLPNFKTRKEALDWLVSE
jgi:hypothetical protein